MIRWECRKPKIDLDLIDGCFELIDKIIDTSAIRKRNQLYTRVNYAKKLKEKDKENGNTN